MKRASRRRVRTRLAATLTAATFVFAASVMFDVLPRGAQATLGKVVRGIGLHRPAASRGDSTTKPARRAGQATVTSPQNQPGGPSPVAGDERRTLTVRGREVPIGGP